MREQKSVYEMNDRELRSYKRMLRLRRERMNKAGLLILLFATVCMILAGALSYRSIRTNASSGFKYYTSVTVEGGETLWDIVEGYIDYSHYKNRNSYIEEVRSINHLDEDCSIMAGQMLILPYYSSEYVK